MLSRGRLRWPFLLAFVLVFATPRATRADDDVMLQGFWWDSPGGWWRTLQNNAYDFAKSGFRRVWLPPASKDAAGGYGMGYGPYDPYDLGEFDQMGTVPTRFGTRKELEDLTWELNRLGVDPIGDIVLTHRNGGGEENVDGRTAWTRFTHPHGRFELGFHDFDHSWKEWKFGENLDYWKDYVRHGLKEWGSWLTDAVGLKGYRIDQAKELDPNYLREWLGHGAMFDKFAVSEFFDTNMDKLDWYAKTSGAKVFDFPLFYKLREMANDRAGFFDMRNLEGAGYSSRNPYGAVTFVENHDTDRSQPISFDKMMAYSWILFHEGTPTVFLKDYWEYGLKDAIDPLIAIRRTLLAGGTRTLYADNNLIIHQRDGWDGQPGAILVLNNHGTDGRSAWVSVKPEWAGQTLIDYTGNQGARTVESDGRVELSAGPRGYAIYSINVPGFDPKSASFASAPPPDARDGLPVDMNAAAQDPTRVRATTEGTSSRAVRVGAPSRSEGLLGGVDRASNDVLKERVVDGSAIRGDDAR